MSKKYYKNNICYFYELIYRQAARAANIKPDFDSLIHKALIVNCFYLIF